MPGHIPPTAFPVRWKDVSAAVKVMGGGMAAVEQFKCLIGSRVGSDKTYLVDSGRSALTLILKSLPKEGRSNKVVIPAYSCSTVLQSVMEAGLEPEFCDLSLETLDFDQDNFFEKISTEPLAVVGVHLYGLAQDFSEAAALCRKTGIVFIEDAAQAFGAKIHGQMVGMQGDFGLFSLGSGKCLPVGGGGVIVGGGAAISNLDQTYSREVMGTSSSGLRWIMKLLTYKLAVNPVGWWLVNRTSLNPADTGADFSRLPEIKQGRFSSVQAGIGLSLIQNADESYQVWRDNAAKLISVLGEFDFLQLPKIDTGAQPVFLRLPVVVDDAARADRLFAKLEKAGIGVSRSYRFTLPGVYSELAAKEDLKYPGADHLTRCLLTLPTNGYLDDCAVEMIYKIFSAEQEAGRSEENARKTAR